MFNTTVVKANGANHIVSAAEAGMERWREKFAPERPLDACCHTCGGGLCNAIICAFARRTFRGVRSGCISGRVLRNSHRGSCAPPSRGFAAAARWTITAASRR